MTFYIFKEKDTGINHLFKLDIKKVRWTKLCSKKTYESHEFLSKYDATNEKANCQDCKKKIEFLQNN